MSSQVIQSFDCIAFDADFTLLGSKLGSLKFSEDGNVSKEKIQFVQQLLNERISELNVYKHEIEDILQYM